MIRRSTNPNRVERSVHRSPKAAGEKNSRSQGSSRRAPHGELFVAGSKVRESGIYEVLHDAGHRASHEAVMIANDRFPACEVCEDRVRYRVLRTAPYIFSDVDFEESKD